MQGSYTSENLIVDISFLLVLLQFTSNIFAKGVLGNAESLTEERVDEVLNEFMKDFKEGSISAKGWPVRYSAYFVSKAAFNAYTRIAAKKYHTVCINCVDPGFINTEFNYNTGILAVEEGTASPVRVALMPHGGPSGVFYAEKEITSFV